MDTHFTAAEQPPAPTEDEFLPIPDGFCQGERIDGVWHGCGCPPCAMQSENDAELLSSDIGTGLRDE